MTVAPPHIGSPLLDGPVARLFRPTGHGSSPLRVGLEIELIPVRPGAGIPSPVPVASIDPLIRADRVLSSLGRLSFEPGGQVELSLDPAATPAAALAAADAGVARMEALLAPEGIVLACSGSNPWHGLDAIGLQVTAPRYRSMQQHFDRVGGAGRRMMRQTASLQVCLDLGDDGAAGERFEVLTRSGPALAALFANSPLLEGRATGHASTRTCAWLTTDPSRTGFTERQCSTAERTTVAAYTDFAAQAEVIPLPRRRGERLPAGISFAEWSAASGGVDARPDGDDIEHHLSTLFPPVRPRGYLEVRFLDAVPRTVASAAITAVTLLAGDRQARRSALEILRTRRGDAAEQRWHRSAQLGLADAPTRALAAELLDLVLAAGSRERSGALPDGALRELERMRTEDVPASRHPGDRQLEQHIADPTVVPRWS